MEKSSTRGGGSNSPVVDCLLGGLEDGVQERGLLGSYFAVCALEVLGAPPGLLESLHVRLERAVRAASPQVHARLLCVQYAMGRALVGVGQMDAGRRAALLSSLADCEAQAPQTLGKAAPGVRALLNESVGDEADAPDNQPTPQGPPPNRSTEDWAQVREKAASTVLRMTSDMWVVEDVVQEALLKTFLGDWRTQGRYQLGGLIRYARTVAYNGMQRVFRNHSRWCPLMEEAPGDLASEENSETKDYTPRSQPVGTDYLDLLLHVPTQLGQLKPKEGLLIFADLVQVPRGLLSSWLKTSRKALNTAIFRAWEALEKVEEAAPLLRMEEEAILRKLEPFGLALAEAACTSEWEWPDDDPPPSGGGGGRGSAARENTGKTQDTKTNNNTRGDAMAHNENDSSKLKSPLAMLLRYAAKTKKQVPPRLLAEVKLDSLGRETQDALRNANPRQWQAAIDMRDFLSGRSKGLPSEPFSAGACSFYAFARKCQKDNQAERHAWFVQVSVTGDLATEDAAETIKVLEGLCYRALELKTSAVVLDLRSVSRVSDCVLPELRKLADLVSNAHGLEFHVTTHPSQQRRWETHGIKTLSAPEEMGPCTVRHGDPIRQL